MAEDIADSTIATLRTSVSTDAANFADDVLSFANALHSDNNALGNSIFLNAGVASGELVQLITGGLLPTSVIPQARQGIIGGLAVANQTQMNVGTNNESAVTPARLRDWYLSRPVRFALSQEDYLTTTTARSAANPSQAPLGAYTIPSGVDRVVVKLYGAGGGGGPQASVGTGTSARTRVIGGDGGSTTVSIGVDTLTATGGHPGGGGSSYDAREQAGGVGASTSVVLRGEGAAGGAGGSFRGGDDREIEGQDGQRGGLLITRYDTPNVPASFTYRLGLGGLPGQEQGSDGAPGENGYIIVQLYYRVKDG